MHNGVALTCMRFRLIPVRSPLLRESRLLYFPAVTEMCHFTALATYGYVFTVGRQGMTPARFPHSDIPGSNACMQLTEAYRSLPRPSSPART